MSELNLNSHQRFLTFWGGGYIQKKSSVLWVPSENAAQEITQSTVIVLLKIYTNYKIRIKKSNSLKKIPKRFKGKA